jgi:hypothetical protein
MTDAFKIFEFMCKKVKYMKTWAFEALEFNNTSPVQAVQDGLRAELLHLLHQLYQIKSKHKVDPMFQDICSTPSSITRSTSSSSSDSNPAPRSDKEMVDRIHYMLNPDPSLLTTTTGLLSRTYHPSQTQALRR